MQFQKKEEERTHFLESFQKKEKRQTTVRFDSHHVRLRTGEVQRKTGSYMYRWTDKLGKRNTIYAATLEDLREQEEQILVDQHDGIKANIKNVTVNDVYELWCQLKRGIKDSTMKNYIYMYELFVKPTFGKKKLVQVKKSDVRRFYNQLIDDKVLKPSTVDVIHNIVHQVFHSQQPCGQYASRNQNGARFGNREKKGFDP